MQPSSLFERLGGESALLAAVPLFYDKVLADPELQPFFARLDLEAQVRKQIGFLGRALGGPGHYHGRDLRTAHAGLVAEGLTDRHFDAIVRHLGETLGELGVAAESAGEAVALVDTLRDSVLGR